MVTAKFKVHAVTKYGEGDNEYRQVHLLPVYSSDPTSPNYSWSKWTPSGKMEMTITNPGAFKQFEVGGDFLLTFEAVSP
jgi:hypothetical protein